MFERFTDQARQVLLSAQWHALRLQHASVDTEHLLLGLLDVGDAATIRAMACLGVAPEAVRQRIERRVRPGAGSPGIDVPFTRRAGTVLELALREAAQMGRDHVGPEHLLLGLVREGHGTAAQVLSTLGADPRSLRRQVISQLPEWRGRPAGTWRSA